MVAIRRARAEDLELLPTIEAMAAQRFREVGLDSLAGRDPAPETVYRPFLDAGGLFVAVAPDDTAIGYCVVGTVEREGYLDEIDVIPAFGQRGVGDALLQTAETAAVQRGHSRLRLTTFADVPWNGPWYRRRGYRPIDPDEAGDGLRQIWRRQADLRKLAPRLLMERRLAGKTGGHGKGPPRGDGP